MSNHVVSRPPSRCALRPPAPTSGVCRSDAVSCRVEQKARQCLALSDYGYVLDMGQNRMEGTGQALLNDREVIDAYLGSRGRLDLSALKRR